MRAAAVNRDWRSIRNASYIGLGVLGLVAATMLFFAMVLEDIYGSWVLDQPDAEPVDYSHATVGVVDSNVRRLWSKARADDYIKNWTEFLEGINVKFKILEPSQDGGFEGLEEIDVLLVLTPQGLTAAERREIAQAIAKGLGGIFSVSTSMHEDEGILFHGGFWKELLRADQARVYEFDRQGFVPFSGQLPFDGSVAPGEGIFFEKGMKAVTLSRPLNYPEPAQPSVARQAVLDTDHGPEAAGVPGSGEFLAEIEPSALPTPPPVERVEVRWGTYEAGRWIVLGFDPSGVPSDSPSRSHVSRLLVSATTWVVGRPMYEIQPWPDGKRLAVMLAVDLAGRRNPPAALDREMSKLGLPLTYFYQLPSRPDDQRLSEPLSQPFGEVATRGLEKGPFKDRALEEQLRELREAKGVLRSALGGDEELWGFMPPGEVYDEDTFQALIDADYHYLYGQLSIPIAVPVIRWVDRPVLTFWRRTHPVVLIPRTIEDDLDLYLRTGDPNPKSIADRYLEEFDRFKDLGGLFTITLHADFFEQPGSMDALRGLIERLQAPEVWFANGNQIADWWLRRGSIVVTLDSGPPHRLVVRIANVGSQKVENAVVRVQLPEATSRMELRLAHWRRTDVTAFDLRHLGGSYSADIIVKELPAGANEIVYLDWR